MTMTKQPQSNIRWANLYFEADSSGEPFTEVTILSTKGEFIKTAREQAFDQLTILGKSISNQSVNKMASHLIQMCMITIFEYVEFLDEGITVCINADLDDEETRFKVLDMVYMAVDNGGKWIGKTPLSFDILDLPELFV